MTDHLTHPDQTEDWDRTCPSCRHLVSRLCLIRDDRNRWVDRAKAAENRAALAEEKLRELQG